MTVSILFHSHNPQTYFDTGQWNLTCPYLAQVPEMKLVHPGITQFSYTYVANLAPLCAIWSWEDGSHRLGGTSGV